MDFSVLYIADVETQVTNIADYYELGK